MCAERDDMRRLSSLLTHGSGLPLGSRLALYLAIGILALGAIWISTGLFLIAKPTLYTSSWALILPGSGAGHAVSLDSVGQATATMSSPYSSLAVDPRVNYKALAESEPVLSNAAARLDLEPEEFGKPRIMLADQTALMNFKVTARNPELAQRKSRALYRSLQDQLERLRNDEMQRREAGASAMLAGFSEKLRQAQLNIIDHQAQARIVSLDQFNEMTLSLERLRDARGDLLATRAAVTGQLEALQNSMDVPVGQATAFVDLQQDILFRRLIEEWAEASVLHTRHKARWGRKHQKVLMAGEVEKSLRLALISRARAVAPGLKFNTGRLLARGADETGLYTRLVELTAQKLGRDRQLTVLDERIEAQARLLESSSTEASKLEDLKRKQQVATAVFTTALAKIDIGKSDRFSAYPLVQMLAEPSLPTEPDHLARNLVLAGAGLATLFTLLGLVLLWVRKPYIQKRLKNA